MTTDGIHWQDPREPMYNQPACGAPNYAPTATTRDAVTCPVCAAETEGGR